MSTDRRGEKLTRTALISAPPEVLARHAAPELVPRESVRRVEARAPQRQESRQMVRYIEPLYDIEEFNSKGRSLGTNLLNHTELVQRQNFLNGISKFWSGVKMLFLGLAFLVSVSTMSWLLGLLGVALPAMSALWVLLPALAFAAGRSYGAARDGYSAKKGELLLSAGTAAILTTLVLAFYTAPVFAIASTAFGMAMLGITGLSALVGAKSQVRKPLLRISAQQSYEGLTEVDGELYDSQSRRL